MLISETAFYTLGASPNHNRKSLLDLINNINLNGDENIIRDAYRSLTLNNKRIIHEISWTLGVPDNIDSHVLINKANKGELNVKDTSELLTNAPVAFCNLASENLNACIRNKKIALDSLNELLTIFAHMYEKIDAHNVLEQINATRIKADFPIVKQVEDVVEALRENKRTYIKSFQELHKAIPTSQYVRSFTQVIESITSIGEKACLVFLEELISAYTVDISEKMGAKVSTIKKISNEILELLEQETKDEGNDEVLDATINKLHKHLTAWDVLAQPIQVTCKSQGKEHQDSVELAKEIRYIALKAHNDYDRPDVSIKICEMLSSVFAEVPSIKATIDEDLNFLSKLIVNTDEHIEIVLERCLNLSNRKKSPELALKEVEECISTAKEELLKTDKTSEIKEILINALRSLAIRLANEHKAYLAALAILNETMQFVINDEQKENLNKNIEIIESNLFAILSD